MKNVIALAMAILLTTACKGNVDNPSIERINTVKNAIINSSPEGSIIYAVYPKISGGKFKFEDECFFIIHLHSYSTTMTKVNCPDSLK